MGTLVDPFGRRISYLRVSVTDRCNLRCTYCMPEEGVRFGPRESVLSYEEILMVVRACAELGVTSVRLTGGEPLVRKGIPWLVRQIASVPGIGDLAMTTNGVLLAQHAEELARAGLRRVNISLDSLRPERFQQITRFGRLEDVLCGVDAALDAGLKPVKLNVVVMRGVNDDEVADLARLTLCRDVAVRFIELMPIGPAFRECALADGTPTAHLHSNGFVSSQEVKARLQEVGDLQPAQTPAGAGPAEYWRFPGAKGTVGFISQVTSHACGQCNRLRLTSDGRIRPCLTADSEVDLRTHLRRGADVDEIKRLVAAAVARKPEKIKLEGSALRPMSQIGG